MDAELFTRVAAAPRITQEQVYGLRTLVADGNSLSREIGERRWAGIEPDADHQKLLRYIEDAAGWAEDLAYNLRMTQAELQAKLAATATTGGEESA